ncbi:MAG: type II toxin-antitoxin system prevent-host-death family antitoxin [Myxococcales bacterium]|nr:type II toxin-antitoxin system prevent-host-death family antitoxin [Myxococcales bacterium]
MTRRSKPRKPQAVGRKRLPISQFKAHCLRLLDEVSHGQELVVTRHGEEIALVSPARRRTESEYGSLKGLLRVQGDIVHCDWSQEFDVLRDDQQPR